MVRVGVMVEDVVIWVWCGRMSVSDINEERGWVGVKRGCRSQKEKKGEVGRSEERK